MEIFYKKVVLKKSLNNDEMFRNLDEASLPNYLKEIEGNIYIDLFNDSLDAQKLVSHEINADLLVEKELNIYFLDLLSSFSSFKISLI